jgi:hypothetical protein
VLNIKVSWYTLSANFFCYLSLKKEKEIELITREINSISSGRDFYVNIVISFFPSWERGKFGKVYEKIIIIISYTI